MLHYTKNFFVWYGLVWHAPKIKSLLCTSYVLQSIPKSCWTLSHHCSLFIQFSCTETSLFITPLFSRSVRPASQWASACCQLHFPFYLQICHIVGANCDIPFFFFPPTIVFFLFSSHVLKHHFLSLHFFLFQCAPHQGGGCMHVVNFTFRFI